MKRIQNSRPGKAFLYSRLFFITSLFMFTIFSSYAHASGSKMPTASDGTVITDTGGSAADSGATPPASTTVPKVPVPPKSPGTPTSGSTTTISEEYSHLDPGGIVPKSRLAKALKYFDDNKATIKNKDFIGVIDFSQHSSKERFYVIDMNSGRVETFQVAHGKGSDEDYDGYATVFSNESGSNASSQGIYVTSDTYYGGHGYSLLLDGKSSTNSNARSRAIVIHPADYVVSGQKAGRSWGCPALDPRESAHVIDEVKEGAVIYAE